MLGWFKKSPPPGGPDYSRVDSVEKAGALSHAGTLCVLQLLPEAFGGTAVRQNQVYVPPFVVEVKRGIDEDTVMPLVEQGKVTRYSASPKYQGKSVVPIAIEISASEPVKFVATIAIWGDALLAEGKS